jgi:hypothetical protein
MPPSSFKYVVKEFVERQHPKVVLIDYRRYTYIMNRANALEIRYVADGMPFSLNKIEAAINMRKYVNEGKSPAAFNYISGIFELHLNWKNNYFRDDLLPKRSDTKGNILQLATLSQMPIIENTTGPATPLPINEDLKVMLADLCDYLEEENINAVFVALPGEINEDSKGRMISVEEYLDERGFPYINMFEEAHAAGFDYAADFQDMTHVNNLGREKVVKYLGKYVKEHYDIPDHRADPGFESWDLAYQSYENQREALLAQTGGYIQMERVDKKEATSAASAEEAPAEESITEEGTL